MGLYVNFYSNFTTFISLRNFVEQKLSFNKKIIKKTI